MLVPQGYVQRGLGEEPWFLARRSDIDELRLIRNEAGGPGRDGLHVVSIALLKGVRHGVRPPVDQQFSESRAGER